MCLVTQRDCLDGGSSMTLIKAGSKDGNRPNFMCGCALSGTTDATAVSPPIGRSMTKQESHSEPLRVVFGDSNGAAYSPANHAARALSTLYTYKGLFR